MRASSLIFAVNNFLVQALVLSIIVLARDHGAKPGQIGLMLAGFGLGMFGYVANTQQTSTALAGIKGLQTLYPCLALAVAGAVLWFLSPLSDERHEQIVDEIHDREDAAAAAEKPGEATV